MLVNLCFRWNGLWLLVTFFGALMLYFYGFFPLKYNSGKLAHMDDLPIFIDNKISIDGPEVYNPGVNSVILMVIDGLRYDFVSDEYMPYTGQLLKNKSACIYVSVAEPPTVTMPRIKAMMTGSVSTFADVALNFGAPAVKGDSVLRAAASRGKRLVMYGDDTWLRLFPGLWAEADGTTSFYVTDYTEVDNNVTRHLDKILTPDEKKKPNFDFLVLHYLGLDHIGHLEGAQSPKIKPKLKEMDEVVKKIFTAMQGWDRTGVLMVCGDHGMRDAGGHGGATPAEVLVPLLVAKSADYTCPHPPGPGPTVAQVDVAPSIAWLLNAPIPGDSTGRILPSLLPPDPRQHLYLLHAVGAHNARQPGVPTDKEFYKQFQRAEAQFAHYLATGQQSAAKISKEFYEESLTEMAKYLSESTTEFDLFAIVTAIVVMAILTIATERVTRYSFQLESARKPTLHHHHRNRHPLGGIIAFAAMFTIFLAILVTSCFITETKSQLCSFSSLDGWFLAIPTIACVLTYAYFIIKLNTEHLNFTYATNMNVIDYLLIAGIISHPLTFFGTSFIEEEHMTWYFFWNTLMFFVLIRMIVVVVVYLSKRAIGATEVQEKPELARRVREGVGFLPKWVLLIALHRYLRTMNQTGDRWLFLPDTADWLNAPENAFYLQAHLVVGTLATFVICIWNLRYTNNQMQVHTIFTAAATACVFLYRIATQALHAPFDVKTWDTVVIVDVLWFTITAQFVYEIISYVGVFKTCGISADKMFVYKKAKEKAEDPIVEEAWEVGEIKLNLVRSITHLMLNNMMIIIVLLMRPHNVILVPSIYVTCVLTSKCLDHQLLRTSRDKRTEEVDVLSQALVHLWIGMVFFFYQGNSNSLASVDLGAGYVGLREYCPLRVAARMGLHAYAGPALAGAMLFASQTRRAQSFPQYKVAVWRVTNIYALQRMYSVLVYCIIAAIFRNHLFVWSVFSPKLLYDFVATVFTIQALITIPEIIIISHITCKVTRFFTMKRLL